MRDRSEQSAQIGLIGALVTVVALPIAVTAYRMLAPPAAMGPDALIEAAQEVDAFWARNFRDQFPNAWSSYETPAIRFDDIRENRQAADDGYAGYYINDAKSIHVDLDRDRSDGYLLLVLAHEFGHHVQNLSGAARQRSVAELWSSNRGARQIGVRYELQAECLAGVWAHHAAPEGRLISERDVNNWRQLNFFGGDIPTHGKAVQRLKWFNLGYEGGRAAACDTFEPSWEAL